MTLRSNLNFVTMTRGLDYKKRRDESNQLTVSIFSLMPSTFSQVM